MNRHKVMLFLDIIIFRSAYIYVYFTKYGNFIT